MNLPHARIRGVPSCPSGGSEECQSNTRHSSDTGPAPDLSAFPMHVDKLVFGTAGSARRTTDNAHASPQRLPQQSSDTGPVPDLSVFPTHANKLVCGPVGSARRTTDNAHASPQRQRRPQQSSDTGPVPDLSVFPMHVNKLVWGNCGKRAPND